MIFFKHGSRRCVTCVQLRHYLSSCTCVHAPFATHVPHAVQFAIATPQPAHWSIPRSFPPSPKAMVWVLSKLSLARRTCVGQSTHISHTVYPSTPSHWHHHLKTCWCAQIGCRKVETYSDGTADHIVEMFGLYLQCRLLAEAVDVVHVLASYFEAHP